MPVTKEQVAAEAQRLSMTLTEEQITKFVNEGKLPEKPAEPPVPHTTVEELTQKYTARQLAEMLIDTRSEAADRRRKNKELGEQIDRFTSQVEQLKHDTQDLPGLNEKLTKLTTSLEQLESGEKARRKVKIDTLPENIRGTFDYLLDPKTVSADKFDQSFEHIAGPGRGPGGTPPGFQPPDPWLSKNPFKKGPTFSIGEQVKLKKSDAELAKRLEAAAAQG